MSRLAKFRATLGELRTAIACFRRGHDLEIIAVHTHPYYEERNGSPLILAVTLGCRRCAGTMKVDRPRGPVRVRYPADMNALHAMARRVLE